MSQIRSQHHPDTYKMWRTALYVTLQLNDEEQLIEILKSLLGKDYNAVQATESMENYFEATFDMDQDIARAISMAAQNGKLIACALLCDKYLGVGNRSKKTVEKSAIETMRNNGFNEEANALTEHISQRNNKKIDLLF